MEPLIVINGDRATRERRRRRARSPSMEPLIVINGDSIGASAAAVMP